MKRKQECGVEWSTRSRRTKAPGSDRTRWNERAGAGALGYRLGVFPQPDVQAFIVDREGLPFRGELQ